MMQHDLFELMTSKPIVPYFREGDMAVRKPWRNPERRLLDYLLIYVKEGNCRFIVDREAYDLSPGEYCFIQPGSLNELEGLTHTITPFLHFDIFFQPNRENSFPTRPGQIDLSAYQQFIQPRLNDMDGLDIPVRLNPTNPVKFRDAFLRLVELWPLRDPFSTLLTHQMGTELIISILMDHYQSKPTHRSTTIGLDWIPSYMSNHIQEPLSINELANRANLSSSRFSAIFKQNTASLPINT
jgi:hypothetical protein